MAEKEFDVDINLKGNELKNGSFERLPAAPLLPGLGQNYFDTVLKVNRQWDGTQWISGGGGSSLIDYVATQTINKYDPLTSNGEVADSNNSGHRNKFIGIASENVAIGFSGKAQADGEIQNPLWAWTIGDLIYINGTALSKTPPTPGTSVYSQVIGIAIQTDTIEVSIKQSFGF